MLLFIFSELGSKKFARSRIESSGNLLLSRRIGPARRRKPKPRFSRFEEDAHDKVGQQAAIQGDSL